MTPQARVVFDARVQVQGPAFAEDPMNVPVQLRVDAALGACTLRLIGQWIQSAFLQLAASPVIVRNDVNWENVKRFRIKEVWYFDKETSQLNVRILGIAPMIDVTDNEGNFRFEKPMFWVYYPQAREMFARHRVFTLGGNTNATISWEDMFEMRYFASYIYKESNVYDRKIDDYVQGVDMLMESERIKNDIFNFEHDLWQY